MGYTWKNNFGKDPFLDGTKLPDGEYVLLSWSDLPDVDYDIENRVVETFKFPQFVYEEKFTRNNENISLDHWYQLTYSAIRVRNYLAFNFGVQFPIRFKFIGKYLLAPNIFPSSDVFFHLGFYLDGKSQNNIDLDFTRIYEKTKTLLNTFKKDSFEDRIINLFGCAIWTNDPLENFIYRWKILELLSSNEFSKIKSSSMGILGNISDSNMISIIQKIPISYKIKFLLKKYSIEDLDDKKISEIKKIRDKISHGNITSSTYKIIMKNPSVLKTVSDKLFDSMFPQFRRENIFRPRK